MPDGITSQQTWALLHFCATTSPSLIPCPAQAAPCAPFRAAKAGETEEARPMLTEIPPVPAQGRLRCQPRLSSALSLRKWVQGAAATLSPAQDTLASSRPVLSLVWVRSLLFPPPCQPHSLPPHSIGFDACTSSLVWVLVKLVVWLCACRRFLPCIRAAVLLSASPLFHSLWVF